MGSSFGYRTKWFFCYRYEFYLPEFAWNWDHARVLEGVECGSLALSAGFLFFEDCILCLICVKVCGILCDFEFRLTQAACPVAGRIFLLSLFSCARSCTANVLPI